MDTVGPVSTSQEGQEHMDLAQRPYDASRSIKNIFGHPYASPFPAPTRASLARQTPTSDIDGILHLGRLPFICFAPSHPTSNCTVFPYDKNDSRHIKLPVCQLSALSISFGAKMKSHFYVKRRALRHHSSLLDLNNTTEESPSWMSIILSLLDESMLFGICQ